MKRWFACDEALELLEADSDVQLLFTDINMPGAINGLALANCQAGARPLAAHRNHGCFGKTDAATS
jgi:CheY-like chemotaxis protein